jgi:hypothetical protein
MPGSTAHSGRRRTDLVLARLFQDAVVVTPEAISDERQAATAVDGIVTTVQTALRQRASVAPQLDRLSPNDTDSFAVLNAALAEWVPFIAGGLGVGALRRLLTLPPRALRAPGGSAVLLGAFRNLEGDGATGIQTAVVLVRFRHRQEARPQLEVQEIEDYSWPARRKELIDRLIELAQGIRFSPQRPLLNALLLLGPPMATRIGQREEQRLQAVAAVMDMRLRVLRVTDAGDVRQQQEAKAVVRDRLHELLLVCAPGQRWFSRQSDEFDASGRRRVHLQSGTFEQLWAEVQPLLKVEAERAGGQVVQDDGSVTSYARLSPPDQADWASVPSVLGWSVARPGVLALAREGLELTARARKMLTGNPYPHPERMLDHLERFARGIEAFRRAEGRVGMGLAQFFRQYDLEVVMQVDELKKQTFVHDDGAKLAKGPHIKVDDFKKPNEVGRIYFGYDSDNRRFVIDHIGLHNYY